MKKCSCVFVTFDRVSDEEDDDDQDIPAYGFPRNRREPSDIDFIISSAGKMNFITFFSNLCYKLKWFINRIWKFVLQMKIVPCFVSIVKLPSQPPWNPISKMIWIHRTQRPPHRHLDHRVVKVWNGPIIYKPHKSDHGSNINAIINVLSIQLP